MPTVRDTSIPIDEYGFRRPRRRHPAQPHRGGIDGRHPRLPWTNSQQRRFEWLLTCLRGADRVIPHGLWVFGYRLYLQTSGAENGSFRKVRTS